MHINIDFACLSKNVLHLHKTERNSLNSYISTLYESSTDSRKESKYNYFMNVF